MQQDTTRRIHDALGQRSSAIHVEQLIEPYRKVESWVFSTAAEPLTPELRATLLGVHYTAQDYLAIHPFLIFPIPRRLEHGEVFSDVFVLEADASVPSPADIHHFLANGTFMRECLSQCYALAEDDVVRLHSIDAIELLFGHNFFGELARHTYERGLVCLGVVGTDPVHALRGKVGGP